jgi:AsmA protein
MPRALRITLITLGIILLVLVTAVVAATQLIDPNSFKPRISEAAREHAGLDLDLQGDLDWAFWPSLGLSLGRTETRLTGEEELFAALDEAHMGVAVWPLLFGEVRMDEIRLDGLNLNLVRTADGANWARIGPADKGTSEPAADEPAGEPGEPRSLDIPITIPEIAVTDGRLRYRDTTNATDIRVDHIDLNARDVTLKEAFPVSLSLRYQDQADIRVDLDLDTEALLEPDNNHYRFAPFSLTAEVGGLTVNPATVRLDQSLDVNLERERLRVEDFTLRAADTRTRGNLEVTGWSSQPAFSGQIKTEPFDANKALQAVGIAPIETSDPKALSRVAFNAKLQGTNSLMADPLTLTLDGRSAAGPDETGTLPAPGKRRRQKRRSKAERPRAGRGRRQPGAAPAAVHGTPAATGDPARYPCGAGTGRGRVTS